MDKNFTVGLDLDDSEYRNKFRKLMDDVERETRSFKSKYSQQDVEQARRRVEHDSSVNPFTTGGRRLADDRDKKIVREDEHIRQLNKNLEEAQKQQSARNLQERRRHDEYRSMTSKQLEFEQKKIQRDLAGAEKSGDGEAAGNRARELRAIQRERSVRGAMGSAQDDTVRRLGSHIFMNQLMGGLMTGRMGEYYGGTARAGMAGFSMARTGGSGVGGALLAGGITAAIAGIIKLFSVGEELTRTYMQGMRKIGSLDIHREQFDLNKSEFLSMGISRKGYSEMISPFLQNTLYTGSSSQMGAEIMKQQRVERVLGISSSQLGGLYTGGGFGDDRVDVEKTTAGLARFLESRGVAGIKTGIGPGGQITDRNLVRLPEYLQKLIDINENIYRITGEKSEEQFLEGSRMFGSAVGMGGIFERADVAGELIQGIRKGFAQPSSPLHEFYNIQAFRQVSGRTDLHSMKLGMENMTDPRVANQMVSNMRNMFGIGSGQADTSKDTYLAYIQMLSTALGVGYTKASEFDDLFGKKGGFTESDLNKMIEQDPNLIFQDSVTNFATAAEVAKASLETGFQSFGQHVQTFGDAVLKFANLFDFGKGVEEAKAERYVWLRNFKEQAEMILKESESDRLL